MRLQLAVVPFDRAFQRLIAYLRNIACECIMEHDQPWTLRRGDIIGMAIAAQPFELIAYMGVKRIGAMARRLRLFNSAAHCYFFASFVRFAPRCRLLSQLSNSFCI